MCERCAAYYQGKTDARFKCKDCAADTSMKGNKEHYMVLPDVWHSVANPNDTLCIGCLEKRLGRMLRPKDFDGYDINTAPIERSPRLQSRIFGCH